MRNFTYKDVWFKFWQRLCPREVLLQALRQVRAAQCWNSASGASIHIGCRQPQPARLASGRAVLAQTPETQHREGNGNETQKAREQHRRAGILTRPAGYQPATPEADSDNHKPNPYLNYILFLASIRQICCICVIINLRVNFPGFLFDSVRVACLFALVALETFAQPHTASDLAHQVLSATLDPGECYHVRDIRIHQPDVDFYLTDGYLILGKPVKGEPVSAVFTTDVEGGDAEVVLLPPDRAERRTMATFTGSPNLSEHFVLGVFFFTDNTAKSLAESLHSGPASERVPDVGARMAEQWNGVVASLTGSLETRVVLDLMTQGDATTQGDKTTSRAGFFSATLHGRTLGEFDVTRDTRATEQVAAGKVTIHNGAMQWDTWTRFVARDRKNLPEPAPEEEILSYNIDASLDSALAIRCVTRIRIRATADSRNVLPFELINAMRVLSAKVDGAPAEVYRHESQREGLVQDAGVGLLLVVPSRPLEPGSLHDVEIVHEGKAFEDTGNQIYSVRARGSWYPNRGSQFASYDVTYHYPASLDLVSAGAVTEDRTENGVRTTRRVPEGRLRLLGVNLGNYFHRESEKNGIQLEVSANRTFEEPLRQAVSTPVIVPNPTPPRRGVPAPPVMQMMAPPPMDPSGRLAAISEEMQSAIQYFRSAFGDPPLKHIEVSPVTGRFGQGFAGMIYLPTVMYIDPAVVPVRNGSPVDEAFMGQLLRAHEVAHQWWGNIVATDSYHHEWLMESLANYSALMFLETRLGPKSVEKALDVYRAELLIKGQDGATAESRGPVVEGRRLESLAVPGAADAVLYGKGTWIIHMLRRKLGDANFRRMLRTLRNRYEWKTITTDEFRQLCVEFLPPGSPDPKLTEFFDQWVYGTGLPALQLTYSVAGGKLTGTLTQTDAPEDFSVMVPVEIRSANAKPVVKLVRTSSGPVKFTADVVGPGAKAILDPGWSILRR
jgi:hypothetical protein